MVGAGVELRAHALGNRLLAADYDAAVGELAILEAVLAALPAIAERRRLLDGPLRTLTGAARAIADNPSTRALAELSALTEEVMQDARRYLGAKIQSRILEGFRKPSFLASLEAFRKAIGSSPRRYERFEELTLARPASDTPTTIYRLNTGKHFSLPVLVPAY